MERRYQAVRESEALPTELFLAHSFNRSALTGESPYIQLPATPRRAFKWLALLSWMSAVAAMFVFNQTTAALLLGGATIILLIAYFLTTLSRHLAWRPMGMQLRDGTVLSAERVIEDGEDNRQRIERFHITYRFTNPLGESVEAESWSDAYLASSDSAPLAGTTVKVVVWEGEHWLL